MTDNKQEITLYDITINRISITFEDFKKVLKERVNNCDDKYIKKEWSSFKKHAKSKTKSIEKRIDKIENLNLIINIYNEYNDCEEYGDLICDDTHIANKVMDILDDNDKKEAEQRMNDPNYFCEYCGDYGDYSAKGVRNICREYEEEREEEECESKN